MERGKWNSLKERNARDDSTFVATVLFALSPIVSAFNLTERKFSLREYRYDRIFARRARRAAAGKLSAKSSGKLPTRR